MPLIECRCAYEGLYLSVHFSAIVYFSKFIFAEGRMNPAPQSQPDLTSFGYGFVGVLIFSLTLPATRIALSGFDPVFVGLGRAIVAAGLSLI